MMYTSPPSVLFSGKIPIGTCKIQDRKTKEYIPVTCYKYDCKDKSDIEDFKKSQNKSGTVPFINHVKSVIEDKLENPDANKLHHVYTLETADGEIAANTHIEEKEDGAEIAQIGANKKAYKYAGRSLIAQMGKDILKDKPDGTLTVFAPNPDAIYFYTTSCPFKYDKNYNLGINKKDIEGLYDTLKT